jgi:ADP-ribosylglycohydrolase
MLGAIVGDIIGSRFEFNNCLTTHFKLFTNDCSFTDDTICTIAVADAIIKKVPFKTSLLKWCRKYPTPMGGY